MPSKENPQGDNPQINAAEPPLSARLWAMVVLTGAGAGVLGGLLMKLLYAIQHVSFSYEKGNFLDGVKQVSPERRVVMLLIAGVIAGITLYALKRATGRQDEPEEKTQIQPGDLDATPQITRILLSIVIVAMGAALGREAALKQAGGLWAEKLARWTRLTADQRRLLVACGAGAGMAAAYNVPFGGALFTAEVLLGSFTLSTILPALAATCTATLVSWIFLPNEVTYGIAPVQFTPGIAVWALLAGPLLGVAAAGFVRGVGWAGKRKLEGWQTVAAPIVGFGVLGLVSMRFPELMGNGKNVIQLAFDEHISTSLLGWLFVLRPLATLLCLRTGAPGGLFTPTMTMGALTGGVLGEGWSHLVPSGDKRCYALVGSGAVLAAASQGPISSIVFLMELTRQIGQLMVPMLIAVVGATVVARRLEPRSIYAIRE